MGEMATRHLLACLSPNVQAKLRRILHVGTFTAGEQIFAQGAPAPAFYIVTSGRVKVVRVTAEGYELILCVPGPGDCFCPVPVLDGGTQLGTAVAVTDGTLLWADSVEFAALCEKSPELLSVVQGICLGEVRRLISRFESLASRRLKERLADAMLAESRHRQSDGFPPHELHLTHQELAELVGAARESVSRLLAQWEQQGVVTLKRGLVIIRNREELQRLAGE
ncbi:MAG: Crp/Fnr family transcriptional regulator [Chloroflexi bacterium]|nr:Crp/Fnr family transcriptional regulator [Chloroflexota bacterium]